MLHGQAFYRLEGQFSGLEDLDIVVKYEKAGRKVIEAGGVAYEKIRNHIGKIPAIIICPNDNELILGGSEERRKFVDGTLSQFDGQYLNQLLAYNKALSQRNSALKQMASQGRFDQDLLEVYNQQLVANSTYIFEERQRLVDDLKDRFNDFYSKISGDKEKVSLQYKSQLFEYDMGDLLLKNSEKDRILQRTSSGLHRDDLIFEIDGMVVKRFGSQGQQKSFLIALKLAQFDLIAERGKRKPILLIDDLFDKLDLERSGFLLELLNSDSIGQVFITDTDPDRIKRAFDSKGADIEIFEL